MPWGGSYINSTSSSGLSSRQQTFEHSKKCFVYTKISWESTNPTQQEYDDSEKKFSNHYSFYKNQPSYK